jgi:uncharacterized damage-inducible protein DinB
MSGAHLRDAFDHHAWATIRLIDACAALTAEQLEATVPGTYGSIIETLRHLVGGDASYLFVLTSGRRHEIEEATMGLPQLRTETERNAEVWRALLAQDLDPATDVVRHRDDGSQSHAPLGVRLAQALHHGSDHRSQVCTVLTTLGIEPPDIDVWAMAQEQGRLTVAPAS